MAAGGAAAAAGAAARRRRLLAQAEEEEIVTYGMEDLANDWESLLALAAAGTMIALIVFLVH